MLLSYLEAYAGRVNNTATKGHPTKQGSLLPRESKRSRLRLEGLCFLQKISRYQVSFLFKEFWFDVCKGCSLNLTNRGFVDFIRTTEYY